MVRTSWTLLLVLLLDSALCLDAGASTLSLEQMWDFSGLLRVPSRRHEAAAFRRWLSVDANQNAGSVLYPDIALRSGSGGCPQRIVLLHCRYLVAANNARPVQHVGGSCRESAD